jgi:peptide/nickel transport system substrate-binding protein
MPYWRKKGEGMKSRMTGSLFIVLGLVFAGMLYNSSAVSQELAKDQVVVIGMFGADLGHLDAHGGVVGPDRVMFPHIYGALVRHPIGDCNSPEFQPDLASKWEISADKLTWTFQLRRGVKWHWGYGEVTSEDVVYSLNRAKNGKTSAFRGSYDNFKEIKAPDRYTVQIVTGKPDPFLLTKVANYFGGFIVCKKAVEKSGGMDKVVNTTKEEIIGTGPFKFLEFKPKDKVVCVRNEDYWEGKPIIESVVFKYIPDEGSREIALLKGEIAGTRGADDFKWINHMKSKGILAEPMGPADLKALYFNLKAKPFDDKRVREAFAYGIGQESILKMQGDVISAYCTSPVPSGTYGYVDAGWAKYKRDPQRAKKLLAEAGYPNGLTVKLIMSLGAWYLDKMVVYQNDLKECGINLEMTTVDHTVYRTRILQGVNPIVIWGNRLPLATTWLRDMYHTDSTIGTPKASNNYMYYSNPEVDKAIEVAETSFDEKVRLEALAKAQRTIVQDLPSIPSIETRTACVRNPWFDLGYTPKNNFLWNYEVGLKTKILKH